MRSCEHSKNKYYCVTCMGAGICEHLKRKTSCIQCKGSDVCEHLKQKTSCKLCNESLLCVHGKFEKNCVPCKGKNTCEHNKLKEVCVDCGGSKICIHKRIKYSCKDCKGRQICDHGSVRIICKDCKGSQICEHSNTRSVCKKCKGGSICEHERIRTTCKDCKGGARCEHERMRTMCVECKGGSLCVHSKIKSKCIICSPENACNNCKSILKSKRKQYSPYCFQCFCVLNQDIQMKARYRTKELHLKDSLLPEYNLTNNKTVGGCSARRPDFFLECFTHSIIIECDENHHSGYNTSCETARINELFTDLADRPIIFIRFNPDMYKGKSCFTKNGIQNRVEWEKRIRILKKAIKEAVEQVPLKPVSNIYICYPDKEIITKN